VRGRGREKGWMYACYEGELTLRGEVGGRLCVCEEAQWRQRGVEGVLRG
jgi:hypothetical protein